MVKITTLCKLKEAGTNFTLLPWLRNMTGLVMKSHLRQLIKILQFLTSGRIQKYLRYSSFFNNTHPTV